MPLGVDAAAPCTAGELGELPRREIRVLDPVELHQLLEHHGPGRHVDPQREGLGREHHLEQSACEEPLDHGLQQRQHPGVVRAVAVQHGPPEGGQAQHFLVLDPDAGQLLVEHGADLAPLGVIGQAQPGAGALLDRALATRPGEDEHDCGQQSGVVEQLHHLGPTCGPQRTASAPAAVVAGEAGLVMPSPASLALVRGPVLAGAAGAVAAAGAPSAAVALAARPARALVHREREGGDPLDRGVHEPVAAGARTVGDHRLALGVDEQVQQLVPDDHVLPQRHRTSLGDDDLRAPAHLLQPGAELLRVGDGRGQRDQLHRAVQVDDHLFPHRPAQSIREVVDLVHHHEAEPLEEVGVRIQHVAQHLGGHHDHLGVGPDRGVPGQQAHLLGAQPVHQLTELLIRQRLDRGGVEDLVAAREREVDGELPHHGLAGPGGGGDQHGAAAFESAASLELEVVELEGVAVGEGGQLCGGLLLPLLGAEAGIAIGG